MKTYQFQAQKSQGCKGEKQLDRFFRSDFEITEASPNDQRQGIDRWWKCRESGRVYSVEYKTDSTAVKTGNAFIETVSVDSYPYKKGWAYTSEADLLVYYLPEKRIYLITFTALRDCLPEWEEMHPTRQIPNVGYKTHGLLVPLADLAEIAEEIFTYRP